MRTLIPTFFMTGFVCATIGTAHASAPAGVWSIPQLVDIIEEASDRPLLVLEGLFTTFIGEGDGPDDVPALGGYSDAAWGVMYYQCKAGDKDMCLMQWGELKAALAAEEPCRGWGNQDAAPGTVRPYGTPTGPDVYPIDGGVVTGFTPCEYLHTVPPPPAEPQPEPVAEVNPEPVAEEPAPPTEETSAEPSPEPTPEPAVESSVETDTRPTAMPTTSDGGDDCSAGGAGGLLGLLALALRRRRA